MLVIFRPTRRVSFDVGADPIKPFPASDDVIVEIALPHGSSHEPAHFRLESADYGPHGGSWCVKQEDAVQVVGHDHEGVERQMTMMNCQIAPHGLCDAAFWRKAHRAVYDFAEHAGPAAGAEGDEILTGTSVIARWDP